MSGLAMGYELNVYCSTCFAMPGELCRSKYIVHGRGEVTPVICFTHEARVLEGERYVMQHSLARQLLATAQVLLRDR